MSVPILLQFASLQKKFVIYVFWSKSAFFLFFLLLKLPYVLLPISKDLKRLEKKLSFADERRESKVSLVGFNVYVVLKLKIQRKCPKTLVLGAPFIETWLAHNELNITVEKPFQSSNSMSGIIVICERKRSWKYEAKKLNDNKVLPEKVKILLGVTTFVLTSMSNSDTL